MVLTVGIDIGGTKIAGGVVDETGSILRKERRVTPSRSAAGVEKAVIELVREFRRDHDIAAVGIGAAGFVDAKRSRVLTAPNLGWVDEPLKKTIEAGVGIPVIVENDANAAAWGEYRFGGQFDEDADIICVTVGTGIGGGLIFNGKLYRGAHGVAAEIGHLNVAPGGRPCGCGNRGCWEQYASGNALVRETRQLAADRRTEADVLLALGDGTPEGVEGKHITEAAREGDPVALAAFDSLARWLGLGMADLATTLDPTAFVIGGGVSEAGDLLLGATRRAFLDSLSSADRRSLPAVKLASLGNDAGLIGAADLARY